MNDYCFRISDIGIVRRTIDNSIIPNLKDWSLTSLKEKLIEIGAKVVSHGRYVAFQMAEVAIPRQIFADILQLIVELRLPADPLPA